MTGSGLTPEDHLVSLEDSARSSDIYPGRIHIFQSIEASYILCIDDIRPLLENLQSRTLLSLRGVALLLSGPH